MASLEEQKCGSKETKAENERSTSGDEIENKVEKLPIKTRATNLVSWILTNCRVDLFIFIWCMGFSITSTIKPILYMNKICSVRSILTPDYKNTVYVYRKNL